MPIETEVQASPAVRAALADPAGHHVHYLLLSADGRADAVRIAGYGQASGVRVWRDEAGDAQWTLVPVMPSGRN